MYNLCFSREYAVYIQVPIHEDFLCKNLVDNGGDGIRTSDTLYLASHDTTHLP